MKEVIIGGLKICCIIFYVVMSAIICCEYWFNGIQPSNFDLLLIIMLGFGSHD